jgi:hypothetical protein
MRIYSYYCCDGTVRTRCRDHIARTGPYRPISRKAFFAVREGTYTNCVECAWEYFTGQHHHRTPATVDERAGDPTATGTGGR